MPIRSLSYISGDNKSLVDSSMTPNENIHKHRVVLSFHRVRESIAAEIVSYQFIDGKHNPEDVLSKNWAHNYIWPTLKSILLWLGDTIECFDNDKLE